jgi:predicted nucleic acid-binding protein
VTAPFLDTNILLRHLLGDHPDQSPRATAWLRDLETAEETAHTADTVIFDAVFTLEHHYRRSKAEIRDALLPLIELPGLQLPGKRRWRTVLDLYIHLNLPLADAYHAVLMTHLNTTNIVSFDHHFDRIPGIVRREP